MARRRRIVRARRANKTNTRSWFAVIAEGTQSANTFTAIEMLEGTDYKQGALQAKARLEAIYFHIAFGPLAAAAGQVNWANAGILVIDNNVATGSAANDPDNVSALTDQRWLWTNRWAVPISRSNFCPPIVGHVKQRVQLTDKNIRLCIQNSDPVESFDYSADMRFLISY